LRLLNRLTRSDIDALSRAERQATSGEKVDQPKSQSRWDGINCDMLNVPPCHYYSAPELAICDYKGVLACRRAIIVTLALEAWKLRHGSLPKSLDELVGPCLDRLPVDPSTGKPFDYYPKGIKDWLSTRNIEQPVRRVGEERIPPHTPFLRSPVAGWAFPIP
jgi:hypothetical protein